MLYFDFVVLVCIDDFIVDYNDIFYCSLVIFKFCCFLYVGVVLCFNVVVVGVCVEDVVREGKGDDMESLIV